MLNRENWRPARWGLRTERGRQDALVRRGEREILLNRWAFSLVAVTTLLLFTDAHRLLLGFVPYLAVNAVLHLLNRLNRGPQELRLLASILLDAVMGWWAMTLEPAIMACVYPIYLWAILGNGFRFGVRWLGIATLAMTATFGLVVATTPYWQAQSVLAGGLLLGLICIPAYASKLIAKLSHAKEAAEAANRAKSLFLASVSHELRTPLNAIIGFGTHMRALDLPREQRDMVEASVAAGEQLLFLIDQLLQVSRPDEEGATTRASRFRLTDLVAETRDMIALAAAEKGLVVHLQAAPLADVPLIGPADALRTILFNLAGNALKFTSEGAITIRAALDGERLSFEVADTGPGIPEEAQERIFEPFQQANGSIGATFGGSGLGLAICRQLATQTGGTLSLSSRPGEGCLFRYEGQVRVAEPEGACPPAALSPRPLTILVVGPAPARLLDEAAGQDGVTVRSLSPEESQADRLATLPLDGLDLVAIGGDIADALGSSHPLWDRLVDHGIPTVLLGNRNDGLTALRLRAEFATSLPQEPSFDELRSALGIASSFAARSFERRDGRNGVLAEERPSVARRVLVADDNRTNRLVLRAVLERAGHAIVEAGDGDEALALLEAEALDAALIDVNMPALTGIEVASLWRQMERRGARLPLIGVTADATEVTRQACLGAGMDRCLLKPIDAPALLEALEQLCGSGEPKTEGNAPAHNVVSLRGAAAEPDPLAPAKKAELAGIGGAGFLAQLAEDYAADVATSRDALRSAVLARDVAGFRFAAHGIKSASANVGADRLAALCAELEHLPEHRFRNQGARLADAVQAELDRVLEALEQWTPAPRAAEA